MVDLKLIAKGGLIILVIIAIAVLIEQLTWPGNSLDDDIDDFEALKINDTFVPYNETRDDIYNKDFVRCLRKQSESPYYPINQRKNISYSCVPAGRCMHNFLIRASRILESLNLRFILIEPSLLFCLLPSSRKYNLVTRGFSTTEFKGLKNVITLGVESSKAGILDEAKTRKRLLSFRFKILRLAWKENSAFTNRNSGVESIPHYLLIHYDMVIHIVVLYPKERGSFLFSPGFDTLDLTNVNSLQYINDRVFENFTTSTTYLDVSSVAPVLLPSDSRCFLLDMMSSQYLSCKDKEVGLMSNKDAEVALKELKSVLASQMVIFWMWSKSLQGWYEKCDIEYYSKKLKFAVAAKSVEGFNFPALFSNSSCEHTESYFDATNNINNVQLDCYGVDIDLIFMYEDKITYWTEYSDEETIYKLRFPKFTLCSTDIHGEKVNVPCETGEILGSHYGQFLKNSTLKLHPKSMKSVEVLKKRK